MISLNFPIDPQTIMVADTSVIINLNATGHSLDIIRAYPGQLVITEQVFYELVSGNKNGHQDGKKTEELMKAGVVQLVKLGDVGNGIYETLITGAVQDTLDDGEAATIGYANEIGGGVLIDERKATSICGIRFPTIPAFSTIDLLAHNLVESAIGKERQVDAIVNAFTLARMGILPERRDLVVRLIGEERASHCRSLPMSANKSSKKIGY